jgi:hypothetical protein
MFKRCVLLPWSGRWVTAHKMFVGNIEMVWTRWNLGQINVERCDDQEKKRAKGWIGAGQLGKDREGRISLSVTSLSLSLHDFPHPPHPHQPLAYLISWSSFPHWSGIWSDPFLISSKHFVHGYSSTWWCRQYLTPKSQSTSTRLYSTISHKAVIFILTAVITKISYKINISFPWL